MPVRLGRGRGARRGDPRPGLRACRHRRGDPRHRAHPYALASVTKPVTAAAVCVAADEGLLDLDAPGPLGATPRQLLRHRGGLGAHYDFHYGEEGEPAVDVEPYTRLHRAPGSGFEYANLGYRLLGRLLEEATGQDLATYARERVLGPLGLDGFRIATVCPGAATRYTPDGRPYPEGLRTSHPGATLGWATAPQLALFAQTWPRLLKSETAAAVLDAVPIGEHLGYGLGWCVSRGEGPLLVSHGGGMGGVAAMAVSAPELGLSVAVLTNTTAKAARDAVVDHVLGELVPGFAPELISPVFSVPARPLTLKEGSGRATPRHRRARSRCGYGSCRAPAPNSPPAARPPPPPSAPRPPSRCEAPFPYSCRPPTRGSAVRCSVWNCVWTRAVWPGWPVSTRRATGRDCSATC
ncbi:serine hydrolase domain-containing protein [Streptomyces aureus]